MPHGTLDRLKAALLAAVLAACSADDARTSDEPDAAAERTRDSAAADGADDHATAAEQDGDVDAARASAQPTRARDAAKADTDARTSMPMPDGVGPSTAPGDAGRADAGTPRDAGSARSDAGSSAEPSAGAAPMSPAFHIALRVHRADSGLTGAQLASVLEEMNEIWWKQAAICFEVEVVRSEERRRDGFDMWMHRSQLGCGATGNGVYCGDHDIHSLDAPSLNRTDDPDWDTRQNPARTSAHELGHGLSLEHYNGFPDSNDSLMSSGRQGFKLHESEVASARRRAQTKALADSSAAPCAPVPVVD